MINKKKKNTISNNAVSLDSAHLNERQNKQ